MRKPRAPSSRTTPTQERFVEKQPEVVFVPEDPVCQLHHPLTYASESTYVPALLDLDLERPQVVDWRPAFGSVFHQEEKPTSAASAVAGAVKLTRQKYGLAVYEPSRSFLAALAGGTDLSSTLHALVTHGVCSERNWPYTQNHAWTPSDHAKQAALQHPTFSCVSHDDPESVKSSVALGFPVVFAMAVYTSFLKQSVVDTGVVPVPDTVAEENLGHQALLIVGYDDASQHYIVANSWGADWGSKGFCFVPYSYVHCPAFCKDFASLRVDV
jgi:hypothetical protein